MDYKAIIFDGYFNPSSRKNLKSYFKRQFINAEKENHSYNELFDGFMNEIQFVEDSIEQRYHSRKNDLFMILNLRNNGMKSSSDSPKPLNEDDIQRIEDIENEITELNKENFPENLFKSYSDSKYLGRIIKWSEIQHIKHTIIKVKPKEVQKPSIIEPLDFNLNQTDVVHFFDLLVDADIIKEPTNEVHKKTKGGFYGKLSQYFTAKGRSINSKSAKQVKQNKKDKASSYSDAYYNMLRDLRLTIDRKLR